ncbi:hypothetical protein JRO89_XS09G0082800 [Xanthoceras sorbifolium]|uniref:CCHC-type domain-containing protein n=1 Tax=Xanthoceras sorbifolium TaxID=99658 RepID=A0ABQ8HKX6_9ROSI|nr:hypothetical protein JRO89_XS09G0082800 [Xanthoceras sorbifolium]
MKAEDTMLKSQNKELSGSVDQSSDVKLTNQGLLALVSVFCPYLLFAFDYVIWYQSKESPSLMANSGVDGRIPHLESYQRSCLGRTYRHTCSKRIPRERVNPRRQQQPLVVEDDSDSGDDGGYETYRQVRQNRKFDEYRLKADIPGFNGNMHMENFLDWISETTAWKNSCENVAENADGEILPPDYEQYLFEVYQNCEQGNKSIFDYTSEFLRLSARNNLIETEQQRVSRYLHEMMEKFPRKFDYTRKFTLESSSYSSHKGKAPQITSSTQTNTVVEQNHDVYNGEDDTKRQTIAQANKEFSKNPNPYARAAPLKCYRCGKSGHKSNDCPSRKYVNLANHILLGRPWQYDVDITYRGRSNMCKFHWGDHKIAILPSKGIKEQPKASKVEERSFLLLAYSEDEFYADAKGAQEVHVIVVKALVVDGGEALAAALPLLPHSSLSVLMSEDVPEVTLFDATRQVPATGTASASGTASAGDSASSGAAGSASSGTAVASRNATAAGSVSNNCNSSLVAVRRSS